MPKKEQIQESYSKAIEQTKKHPNYSCCPPNSCKEITYSKAGSKGIVIPRFGSTTELVEKANIKSGDIIVDFGSGPGYDSIEAAKVTGPMGKVIGIDFTPKMIESAQQFAKNLHLTNVEFKLGEIEHVPLEDNFADIVISNCVINLSLDKQAVFNEAFRILKPNGVLIDADKIAAKELPSDLKANTIAWCSCIGGTLTKEQYTKLIHNAGFININIKITNNLTIEWNNEAFEIYDGIITAKKPA